MGRTWQPPRAALPGQTWCALPALQRSSSTLAPSPTRSGCAALTDPRSVQPGRRRDQGLPAALSLPAWQRGSRPARKLPDKVLCCAQESGKFAKCLELVGTTSLLDSIRCLADGGIVCMTGIVGNSWTLKVAALGLPSCPTAVRCRASVFLLLPLPPPSPPPPPLPLPPLPPQPLPQALRMHQVLLAGSWLATSSVCAQEFMPMGALANPEPVYLTAYSGGPGDFLATPLSDLAQQARVALLADPTWRGVQIGCAAMLGAHVSGRLAQSHRVIPV